MDKFVEVMGGYMSGGEGNDKDGKHEKASKGTFMMKRSVVVAERDLGFLMRRDWELCAMPVIKVRTTNRRPY